MTRRRLLKFVLPVVAVLAATGIALAFWSSTGTGPSDAIAVASLPGPANVTATVTPGQSTVSVDWDAAQLSNGQDPEGYRVTKTDGSSTTTDACGTSSSTLITATTDCSDTSVPDGVYTYKVIAVYHSFTGTGTASTATHVATETDAPTATLTFPANGSSYAATAFDNGCTTAGFCGTASDTGTGASGVHTVQVEIQQVSSGKFFDGSGFNDTGASHYVTAGFDSGTGNWSYGFDHTKLPVDGDYTVSVKATDWAGNDSSVVSNTFTYDTVAPQLTSLVMKDTNGNGKVDQVVATFDDNLASSTDTSVWHLNNAPSGATTLSNVSTSGHTATLTIAEGSGAADTSVGSFTVSLDASATGIRDAAGNQSSFSNHAPTDGAAPALVSLQMFDNDHNGKVDQVQATFSETLGSYSAANSIWHLVNVPSGGSLNTVSVSGTTATLNLNEGAGAADTSAGTFAVTLDADPNGIQDSSGNHTSFAGTGVADKAPPVRLSLQMFDNNGTPNGKIDTAVATYSENLANYQTANSGWSLANVPSGGSLNTVTRGSGANQNQIIVAITEGGNPADTSVGSPAFTVSYAAPGGNDVRDAANNHAASFSGDTPADKAPPVKTGMTMLDQNGNGKVDTVTVNFSETLATPYTPGTSGTTGWTVSGVPGGGSLSSADVSGSTATLTLTEGSTQNTSNTGFTVALAQTANGVRDGLDNRSSFAATQPADGAAPVLVSLQALDTGGTTGGTAGNGKLDKVVATYSEALQTTNPGTWSLTGLPTGASQGSTTISGSAVTVAITEGNVDTSVGSIHVQYTAPGTAGNGVRDAANNLAASFGPTAPTDAAPPVLQSLVMQDVDGNGKIDRIHTTWSENIDGTNMTTAPWSLTSPPTATTIHDVAVSGSTVDVNLTEGTQVKTDVGSLRVSMSQTPASVTDGSGNKAAAITTATPTDGAAPVRTAMAIQDATHDGKVEAVTATYSEPIASTTDNNLWTFSGTAPGSGAKGTVTSTGSTVTINITGAAVDTSVPSGFQIAYTAGSTGVKDTSSNANQAPSVAATTPTDSAAPVPTGVSDSDTGSTTDGKFATGDSMTVTFSENITGLPANSTVTLTDKGAGGNNDGVTMSGLSSGTGNLNASTYISNAGTGIATFGPSAVTQTAGNSTFTVTLGTQGNTGVPGQNTTATAFNYVPASTITDGSGNPAVANATLPASFTIRLF